MLGRAIKIPGHVFTPATCNRNTIEDFNVGQRSLLDLPELGLTDRAAVEQLLRVHD